MEGGLKGRGERRVPEQCRVIEKKSEKNICFSNQNKEKKNL